MKITFSLLFTLVYTHIYSQQNIPDSLIVANNKNGPVIEKHEFNQGNIVNPIQLIQGKIAGLSISKAGDDPNKGFEIRLRGLSTINGNSIPLYVIDGVPVTTLDNLDPNDVESISVLKNGSSIYPSGGTSGVILISTRKSKIDRTTIQYNVYTSSEQVARNLPSMTAAEWRKLSKETGFGTDLSGNTDWNKAIEQTALSQSHNISMSGGSDKTSYRASINYRNAEGVMKKTGFSQLNGRIGITQKAMKDKLTLDLSLAATERESQMGFADAFKYAAISNPTSPIKSSDPQYVKYDGYFQQVLFDYYNPLSIIDLDKNEQKNKILNASLKGNYEILKGLNIYALYAIQNISLFGGMYFDKNDYFGGLYRSGLASRSEDNSSDRILESEISYDGNLNQSTHLGISGGYFSREFTNEGFYTQGGNFLTDDFSFNSLGAALDFKNGIGTVSSYRNTNKEKAFFGQMVVDFKNILSVTAGARYEGSSLFGSSEKWIILPSGSVSVNLTEFTGTGFFETLRLHAGYAMTGNKPGRNVYSISSLKWEKKGEFDAGLEYSVLKSRLTGSLDYYSSMTTDVLFIFNMPVPPNIYSQSLLNAGKLKSSGLELSAEYKVLSKANFSYGVLLSAAYSLENTIKSLSGNYNGATVKFGQQDLGDMGSPGQNQEPMVRIEEGKPVGQLIAMVVKGIDANGNISYVDQNRDGFINQADRQVVGNGMPKFLLGFGNMITYKNWDLNVFFRCVLGHDLVNTYRALYEVPFMMTTYNLPNTATNMRNSSGGKLLTSTSGVLNNTDIENASFISLDNISFGYDFHLTEGSQIKKIRLYVAGNNLCYITGYKGSDPNPRYADSSTDMGTFNNPLVAGIDRMKTWPRTRSVTLGANFVF